MCTSRYAQTPSSDGDAVKEEDCWARQPLPDALSYEGGQNSFKTLLLAAGFAPNPTSAADAPLMTCAGVLKMPSSEYQSSPGQACYHGTVCAGLLFTLQRRHGAAGLPPSRGGIMAVRPPPSRSFLTFQHPAAPAYPMRPRSPTPRRPRATARVARVDARRTHIARLRPLACALCPPGLSAEARVTRGA